jgi:hypothetical protein
MTLPFCGSLGAAVMVQQPRESYRYRLHQRKEKSQRFGQRKAVIFGAFSSIQPVLANATLASKQRVLGSNPNGRATSGCGRRICLRLAAARS